MVCQFALWHFCHANGSLPELCRTGYQFWFDVCQSAPFVTEQILCPLPSAVPEIYYAPDNTTCAYNPASSRYWVSIDLGDKAYYINRLRLWSLTWMKPYYFGASQNLEVWAGMTRPSHDLAFLNDKLIYSGSPCE